MKRNTLSLFVLFVAMLLASCNRQSNVSFLQQNENRSQQSNSDSQVKGAPKALSATTDSIINKARDHRNGAYLLQLADSLEATGELSALRANELRGFAYYRLNMQRNEEIYYKKVLESPIADDKDLIYYCKAAANLVSLCMSKADYEGALRTGLPVIARMEKAGTGANIDLARLYNSIGSAQLNLKRTSDAAESFERSYNYNKRININNASIYEQELGITDVCNTAIYYLNAHYYQEAQLWVNRTDSLLQLYDKHADIDRSFSNNYHATVLLYNAIIQQNEGRVHEAAKTYRRYHKLPESQTFDGLFDACDYLMPAHRYQEAADNLQQLDAMISYWDIVLSLDNIQQYYFPKYRANAGAGRKDSTIAIGLRILEILDTAIVKQKQSDAAELAAIYDTQQKETEIARQQAQIASKDAELLQERWIATAIAFVLLSIFFTVYTLYRRKVLHQLRKAYNKLEETTAIKERIESELRIARDIQMSMVPSIFPNCEGLDLYASMTPAKEVGGDLYNYVLTDDQLYFCVGDVSGKGVPASLFMAQSTRLFRTLSQQGMTPTDIANRMNAALTEDNEQGMFVTMFIGLLNLSTGRLDFCNAGHNPPIIGGNEEKGVFLDMLPNAPIGLWPGLEYEGEYIEDIRHKPLFIYTDGLNEAENRQQEQFSDERLLLLLRNTQFDSAQQVVKMLEKEVKLHRDGAEANDDLTMMCLRLN